MSFTIAFLPNVGPLEVAIVLIILLIIFGPKRIPAAFRSIGEAFRGFRDTVGGDEEQEKKTAALEKPSTDEAATPGAGDTTSGSSDRNKTKTDA